MKTLVAAVALALSCSSFAEPPAEPPAAVASAAPEFTAVAQDGATRTRADLVGQPTVLWFYPMAGTPG